MNRREFLAAAALASAGATLGPRDAIAATIKPSIVSQLEVCQPLDTLFTEGSLITFSGNPRFDGTYRISKISQDRRTFSYEIE